MDAKYIEDHMKCLHTPDSFARAFFDEALKYACKKVGKKKKAKSVKVPVKVQVTEVPDVGCIQICITINGRKICYHQKAIDPHPA